MGTSDAAPFLIAAAFLAAVSFPALAAPACDEREVAEALLTGTYLETPVWRGVSAAGQMVEVWASEEGSWTLLMTTPEKMSCLLAAGSGWNLPVPRFPQPGIEQ